MADPITISFEQLRTLQAWQERIMKAGLIPEELQPSIDDPEELKRIMAYIRARAPDVLLPGPSYDAVSMFGFGEARKEPLPKAEHGEIVIRYGGWSLQDFRDNEVVLDNNLMWEQDWYDTYQWSEEGAPSGIYHLQIPVPGSNKKKKAKQIAMLSPAEKAAQTVLAATAMLAHKLQTGEQLLGNDWTRCLEKTTDGLSAALDWDDGRLLVSDGWDDGEDEGLWLSSVRPAS